MANSNSIAAAAAALASLAAIAFTFEGFSENLFPHPADMTYSGQAYVGYAVGAWLGVVAVAFGFAAAYYTYRKKHFGLDLAGTIILAGYCVVKVVVLMYAPSLNVGVALSPFTAYQMLLVGYFVASLLSLVLVFEAKTKGNFT